MAQEVAGATLRTIFTAAALAVAVVLTPESGRSQELRPTEANLASARQAADAAFRQEAPTPESVVSMFAAAMRGEPALTALEAPTRIDHPRGYVGILADRRYVLNFLGMVAESKVRIQIWKGEDVPAGRFREAVLLRGNGRICSGTAVGARLVVTAAHCVFDGVANTVTADAAQTVTVQSAVCFASDCSRWRDQGDVALLTLADPLATMATIAASATIDAARHVLVVGFGATEDPESKPSGVKRMVEVPVASARCAGRVEGRPDSEVYGCLAGSELVAGNPVADKDACRGDSGGGLYVRRGSDYLLAAVTSRKVGQPEQGRPCGDGGIYARLDGRISAWLQSKGVQVP